MKITKKQLENISQKLEQKLKLNHCKYAPKSIQKAQEHIDNTIDLFAKHQNFDKRFFNSIKSIFRKLIKNDVLVYLDEQLVLKELYKILLFIKKTNDFLDFKDTKEYNNKFFVKHNNKLKILKSMKLNKSQVLNQELFNLGEQRINWHYKSMYLKNKNLTIFYSYMFSLIDLDDLKLDYNLNSKIELVKFHVNNLLVFNTNENDILKSLSIYLYFQFKFYLKQKNNYSKELTQEILFNLFNYTPNFEEFDKTIYIKSMILDTPIFGAKKEDHFNIHEKQFLIKNLSNELPFFDKRTSEYLVKEFLKYSHISYLQKYPVELFLKN